VGENAHVEDVSLVSLIANPQRYDGKRVRTYGFAVFKFEEQALYLSEADAAHVMTLNATWIDLAPTTTVS
jgi:hypothetical protein